MTIRMIISDIFIVVGLLYIIVGAIGIFKFDNFYPRMLVTSKLDTVGFSTIVVGLGIRHGFTFFTAKMLFIVALVLIINPLVAHVVTGAAYKTGHPYKNEDAKAKDKR